MVFAFVSYEITHIKISLSKETSLLFLSKF